MLNLLFDLNKTDGVFSGDQPGGVLNKSKNWLKLSDKDVDPLDPSNPPHPWENLGEGPLLIPKPKGQGIGVRIAPAPGTPALAAGDTVDLLVSFGARDAARTPYASPFAAATGETVTAFRFSNPLPGASQDGWYFRLGAIDKKPNHENKAHRYEFVVGAIVNSGGITRTYGQDPEMDIGY